MKVIEHCIDASSKVKAEMSYDSEMSFLKTSSKR